MQSFKILVVDDFERFRQFVCLTLQQRAEFQIVGELSDGLQAVLKTTELQPDLVLLDIGLPKLNGIEAGRRIRALSPDSKILFISQDSSADVVEEALRLGAQGYLHKSDTVGELLLAVEAVLQGKQFVSSHVRSHAITNSRDEPPTDYLRREELAELIVPRPSHSHEVVSYPDDAIFVDHFTRFIDAALKSGNAVIVIVTEAHQSSLLRELQARGWDIAAAIQQGMYISLDISNTLSSFMVNDWPDPVRFFKVVSELIQEAAKGHHRVTACGECAPTLWEQGKLEAAIQLEHLWDEIARSHAVDILCGYRVKDVQSKDNSHAYQRICSEHSDSHAY